MRVPAVASGSYATEQAPSQSRQGVSGTVPLSTQQRSLPPAVAEAPIPPRASPNTIGIGASKQQHVIESVIVDSSTAEADAREEEEERRRIAEQMQNIMHQFPDKFVSDNQRSSGEENKKGVLGFVSKLW